MTTRAVAIASALLLLACEGVAWPDQQARTGQSGPGGRAPRRPAPPDVDLLAIRDIFRYRDESKSTDREDREAEPSGPVADGSSPSAVPIGVRLVGVVRRAGTLLAALAVDGGVVLLQEGETAAGVTILGIRDDAVTLRDPEGVEMTLPLP